MSYRYVRASLAILISSTLTLCAVAADKAKKDANQPSYEQPQPQRETLDYGMYQRIRDEGIGHSHVMEYASALDDDIGPRLTGSANLKHANEWTRDQFTAMGCSNAHLEDWGEFGMGWQQLNTWVRMTAPDTAVFIAQAAPWSPATNGAINAPAIWIDVKDAKDLDQYKGKLAGKIVLYGAMRDVPPVDKPLWARLDDAELKKLTEYPLKPHDRGLHRGVHEASGAAAEGGTVSGGRARAGSHHAKPRRPRWRRLGRHHLRRQRRRLRLGGVQARARRSATGCGDGD